MINISLFPEKNGILVCIVDLYRIDCCLLPKIRLYPFSRIPGCRAPVSLYTLIHGIVGSVLTQRRRNGYGLVIVQQHPSGKASVCKIMRIVAVAGITEHDIILVKPRWPDTDPSFKIIFYRYGHGADMPVAAVAILEGGAMSRSPG